MKALLNYKTKPFILAALPPYVSVPNVYDLGIHPVCKELGIHCERALDGVYKNGFSYRLNNQIEKSDIIVVDFTGLNNYVLSIAGFCKGLGKKVIFLIDTNMNIPISKSFPSIIKSIPFIVYQENFEIIKSTVFNEIQNYMTGRIKS